MFPLGEPVLPNVSSPQLAPLVGKHQIIVPPEPLAEHLRCIWVQTMPQWEARVLLLPTGCVDLVWQDKKLEIIGSVTKPTIQTISARSQIVGVRFLPGAAVGWLKKSAAELLNRRVPLGEVWGNRATRLEELLAEAPNTIAMVNHFETELRAILPGISQDSIIRTIRNTYSGTNGVEPVNAGDLARGLGFDERTLRRKCEYAFGYGPRMFGRIMRFQRFLQLARTGARGRLADLAADAGFADQSHLARDVRTLSGHAPSFFVKTFRT